MSWGAVAGAVVGGVLSSKASSRDAARSSRNTDKSQQFLEEADLRARTSLNQLFPQAQEARTAGFDEARNLFGQFVPQQAQAFQQGNFQAQQTAGATPQQQINAILGRPVDFSFLQPRQSFQPNFDFLQAPPQPQEQVTVPNNSFTVNAQGQLVTGTGQVIDLGNFDIGNEGGFR